MSDTGKHTPTINYFWESGVVLSALCSAVCYLHAWPLLVYLGLLAIGCFVLGGAERVRREIEKSQGVTPEGKGK